MNICVHKKRAEDKVAGLSPALTHMERMNFPMRADDDDSTDDLPDGFSYLDPPSSWPPPRPAQDLKRMAERLQQQLLSRDKPQGPQIQAQDEMQAAIRGWLRCPPDLRPSPRALGLRIAEIAASLGRPARTFSDSCRSITASLKEDAMRTLGGRGQQSGGH